MNAVSGLRSIRRGRYLDNSDLFLGIYAHRYGLTRRSLLSFPASRSPYDIARVQVWLGHANISTTRLYDHLKNRPEESPTFRLLESAKTQMNSILEFISTLIWQGIVLFAMYFFRREITALFKKISSIKHGDTEVTFQRDDLASASEDETVLGSTMKPLSESNAETYMTIVASSRSLPKGDKPLNACKIFDNGAQQNWLVVSNTKLFMILDDEKTRNRNRILQWSLEKERCKPIKASDNSWDTGILQIGKHKNWLYSTDIFATPKEATSAIRDLLRLREE